MSSYSVSREAQEVCTSGSSVPRYQSAKYPLILLFLRPSSSFFEHAHKFLCFTDQHNGCRRGKRCDRTIETVVRPCLLPSIHLPFRWFGLLEDSRYSIVNRKADAFLQEALDNGSFDRLHLNDVIPFQTTNTT